MKKAIDIISTAVMVVVIVFAFLLAGVRLFGLTPYTVITGSMEPQYPVGSIIYIKKVSPGELKVNDSITYVVNGSIVVTHRIVEIIPDEDNPTVVRYRTKGDANNDADGTPVDFNSILGKPIFHIPVIGYVAYFVQHPPGSYVTVCALVLILALSFLPGLILGDKSADGEQSEEDAQQAEALVEELKSVRQALKQKQEELNEASFTDSDEKPTESNN